MMGWGRYSGYFFHVYKDGKKYHTEGPFPSQGVALSFKTEIYSFSSLKAGKIWQKEKPVRF